MDKLPDFFMEKLVGAGWVVQSNEKDPLFKARYDSECGRFALVVTEVVNHPSSSRTFNIYAVGPKSTSISYYYENLPGLILFFLDGLVQSLRLLSETV